MKKILLAAIIISQIISSCSKSHDDEDPLLIRINNQTGYQIEEVFVSSGDGQQTFGTIDKGKKSEYKNFVSAYTYGYARLKINNVEYIHPPIDYVGEPKLDPGKHTYKLELVDNNSRYSLRSSYQKD